MFTGIVAAVGRIVSVEPGPSARRVVVDADALVRAEILVGDSIAVAGCCLTVVAVEHEGGAARLLFDVSAETLACTTGLAAPGEVNLELALRLSDRVGGHLMTGHVDGVGSVVLATPEGVTSDGGGGGSVRLEIEAPPSLAPFIAAKGSIAIDGVSLTVNGVAGTRFHANLIPHTLAVTTLRRLAPGDRVNLEVDLIARYVARYAEAGLGSLTPGVDPET
ncbi:MAG: riboflavin synthase [Betaproteobacteria bacterium]